MDDLFTIEFVGDKTIPIKKNQSILEAALIAGIPHYHECGGKARCSTCRILIDAGTDKITTFTGREAALRRKLPIPHNVRLACQTNVLSDGVRIHRIIRDEVDIRIYIQDDTLSDRNLGKEEELALFFLDIRNFTPFMEQYLAFDVIHIMRRLYSLFRNCIEQFSGRIIETAGDGFYAVFGFDQDIKTAAVNSMNAGFSIIQEVENFNEHYMYPHFRHRFQIGIGLHAGSVITGNIGIGVNNNLTVMGMPVNIASRLQSATKDLNNNFIVSQKVYQLTEYNGDSTERKIELKGTRLPVIVHLIGKGY